MDFKSYIQSDAIFQGSSTDRYLRFIESTGQFNGAFFQYEGTTNKFHVGVHAAADDDTANDTKVITIQRTDGFIGINTETPNFELDMEGTFRNEGARISPTFTDITARLAILNPSFGASRLGDSELQTPNIDIGTSLNFKTTAQQTQWAAFANVSGNTLTWRHVQNPTALFSLANNAASSTRGVTDVESTLGLVTEYSNGDSFVFDLFNQEYIANATVLAQAQGVNMIAPVADHRKYGIYRSETGLTNITTMMEIDGASLTTQVATFFIPTVVPDEAYSATWDGDFSVPTKNAVYDQIESLGGGGVTIADNLTTNDPAQALSAAQGVAIAGNTAFLENVISKTIIVNNDTIANDFSNLATTIGTNDYALIKTVGGDYRFIAKNDEAEYVDPTKRDWRIFSSDLNNAVHNLLLTNMALDQTIGGVYELYTYTPSSTLFEDRVATGFYGTNSRLQVTDIRDDAFGGDVSKVGTPVDNQITVWTGDGTIEGDSSFTWDGNRMVVAGTVATPFTEAIASFSYSSAASGIFAGIESRQTGVAGSAAYHITKGSQSWSMSLIGSGTGINDFVISNDYGAGFASRALAITQTDFIATLPNTTIASIDSEATGKALVTKEWVQANAGGSTWSGAGVTQTVTSGTTSTVMYNESIPAGTLANNGDVVEFEFYFAIDGATAVGQQDLTYLVRVGTNAGSQTGFPFAGGGYTNKVSGKIVRLSATQVTWQATIDLNDSTEKIFNFSQLEVTVPDLDTNALNFDMEATDSAGANSWTLYNGYIKQI